MTAAPALLGDSPRGDRAELEPLPTPTGGKRRPRIEENTPPTRTDRL